MFNDKYQLTKAVLEGRKTMTRRIVPIDLHNSTDWRAVESGDYIAVENRDGDFIDIRNCGNYSVGEVVAISQSYNDIYEELKRTHGSSSYVTRQFFHKYIQGGRMPVSNKMFVRAEAMPNHIRITDIKVERLKDISDDDCLKEGVQRAGYGYYVRGKSDIIGLSAKSVFEILIDKISGKGTFESNPWVFVYSFELIK